MPQSLVSLGLQCGLRAAEPDEPFGGDGAELGNIFWQRGFHPWSPKVSRATSIRCTSMVPDATVAAWA